LELKARLIEKGQIRRCAMQPGIFACGNGEAVVLAFRLKELG